MFVVSKLTHDGKQLIYQIQFMYPEEVIRFISGNYSRKDEEFVSKWISEDPDRKEEVEKLQLLWRTTNDLDLNIDVDVAWSDLENQIKENKNRKSKIYALGKHPTKKTGAHVVSFLIKAAAVLLIIAGTYGFFRFYKTNYVKQQKQEQATYQTLTSQDGELVHYRFNDGSKVILNGGSQLRYRNDFGTNIRELELIGEAYFEVNHDHERPFIVYAKGAEVKDIGTKFNINAYPNSPSLEVVVSEGLVEVTASKNTSQPGKRNKPGSVMLSKGQKAELNSETGKLVVGKADLNTSLAWLDNRLVFDEEPFQAVIQKLERYYDVKVNVLDKELLYKQITVSFNNESLENVLKVLSLSLDAEYKIEGQSVEFYKHQQ